MRTALLDGYAVFPVFGFDGVLDEIADDLARLEQIKSELLSQGQTLETVQQLETVQELLSFEGGREIWTRYGYALDMTFDLATDSLSWQIFMAYVESKGVYLQEGWYI